MITMGDRTTVHLSILLENNAAAIGLFSYQPEESNEDGGVITHSFYEVNYGELPFLERLLDAGIPYDSSWELGGQYDTGTQSLRFHPDGRPEIKVIYDNNINPALGQLMALIDKPDRLIAFIQEHSKKIANLPWDNQVHYGRIYKTTRLIDPTFGDK